MTGARTDRPLRRGDVVVVQETGTAAAKARPCVVVQRPSALPAAIKVTVCPLTSHLRGAAGQRPFVAPAENNGLNRPSEVQVDWISTHKIERVGAVIGNLGDASMDAVDEALRRWLAL
jgi:mRNA interferase MazF